MRFHVCFHLWCELTRVPALIIFCKNKLPANIRKLVFYEKKMVWNDKFNGIHAMGIWGSADSVNGERPRGGGQERGGGQDKHRVITNTSDLSRLAFHVSLDPRNREVALYIERILYKLSD